MSEPQFLSPEQLTQRWGGRININTLTNWRCRGQGPSYIKLGAKIAYPLDAVVEYETANRIDAGAK